MHRFFRKLQQALPVQHAGDVPEQVRSALGAMIGLALTGMLSIAVLGKGIASVFLVAPMGASAVLLFCLPASPLAQPWPILGGNLVATLIGVTCARHMAPTVAAAALAAGLAIAAMYMLRCLHPPSGAVALTTVLGGPLIHAAGYQFLLLVMLNSLLLLLAALAYNNATGRRYPHRLQLSHPNPHATADPVPTMRLGFTPDDLDAVLREHNQVLDIARDDLEAIFIRTEMHAYRRRFGVIVCADIMSRDVVTLVFASELDEAWRLMHEHRVSALPVLNRARRVIGIVSQTDFLHQLGAGEFRTVGERLRRLLRRTLGMHSTKPEVVGQIMTQDVRTVRDTTPIIELVPLMADAGLHHIPVVDQDARFVGIVTQSDVIAALYESRLAPA